MTYKIGYDIVVEDSNCEELGDEFSQIATVFENKLGNYMDSLQRIVDGAVKSGRVATNLMAFKEEADQLTNLVDGIHREIKVNLSSFVEDMDQVDQGLY